MAAQYAPLPFSYISAGVKAPKTGLRKDEGLYGTNEHIVRDIPPFDSSQASLTLGPHENGAFSSATSIEEPSIKVNPLYGALVQQPVGGLPRQHKQQPELPQSKHQPTLDNQYRLRNSGSDNQIREDQLYSTPIGRTLSENSPKDQTYGNLQDHELNVYNGPRNHPQLQVAYGKTQQSKIDVGISSADVNANMQKNVHVSSFPPITDTTEFEYDSVPRMLAPTVPVGVNNKLSQLQYGVAAYPPRQNPTSTYAVGPNQTGPTSQAVFVARPAAGTEIPKPSEFAFERPDFSLYAGNVQREPETTSPTVDVQGGVSYPLQPIKTSVPTTVTPSYNRPKSDRHRESGCCGLKTACIVLAIIFVALVCLGAGFVAGWFGRQAALGDTSTVSGSSYSTTTAYSPSTPSTLNNRVAGVTSISTTTQVLLGEPTSTTATSAPTVTSTVTSTISSTTTSPTTTTLPTTLASSTTTATTTTKLIPIPSTATTTSSTSLSTSPTLPTTTNTTYSSTHA